MLAAAAVLSGLAALAAWQPARADMLLAPGNFGLRSDLRLLADAGVLNMPVDTWPIPWSAIASQLSGVNSGNLPPDQAAAVDAVMAMAPKGVREAVTFTARTAEPGLRWFNDTPRGQATLGASVQGSGPLLSWKLSAQAVHDAPDGHNARLDGSYVGVNLGNWMLSAGAVERWWGPAWGGSMMLSSNARPVPSITFQRRRADAFATPWLHWLGPWRMVAFLGQTQAHRAVPRARLAGARFSFQPLQGLTVGLSRVGQWGGDGNDSWTSLRDSLTANDTAGAYSRTGVRLSGLDARWAFHLGGVPLALYGDAVRQQRAAGQAAGDFGQYGVETWGALNNQGDAWRAFAEYADTTARSGGNSLYDVAYNDPVYGSGYRYYDRPIGYAAGSDARMLTLGYIGTVPGSGDVALLGRHGRLNRGGTGYNTVAAAETRFNSVRMEWFANLQNARLGVGLGVDWYHPVGGGSRRHGLLYLSWTSEF